MTTLRCVKTRAPALVLLALVLVPGCSGGSPAVDPSVAASAPVPGLTLPPDPLATFVPQPEEVPAGMVPLPNGSGARTLDVVAGYSGTGAALAAAKAKLTSHGFSKAYVVQYASESTGQVLSVLVSEFATAAGATADLKDDLAAAAAEKTVPGATVGEESRTTVQDLAGTQPKQLVIVRFRKGTHTWSLAYQAAPTADPALADELAKRLVARLP